MQLNMRQRDLPQHFSAALTRVHYFTSRYERNFGVKVVKFGDKSSNVTLQTMIVHDTFTCGDYENF